MAALTEREREVVGLVAAGLSNEEIAGELVVSPLTAKTHVSRAMIKLAARDRAQLVVIAYACGLATPATPSPPATPGPPAARAPSPGHTSPASPTTPSSRADGPALTSWLALWCG